MPQGTIIPKWKTDNTQQNSKSDRDETVYHVRECSKLLQKYNKTRHVGYGELVY